MIEKIRQEIERRLKYTHDWLQGDEKRHPNQTFISKNYYKMKGDERTLDALLNFLDTLSEEERPEPYTGKYDEAYLQEKIAKATKSWEGVDVDKFMDEVGGREPVCEELEEEMDKYFETMPVLEHENIFEDTFKTIARHFYSLGQQSKSKEEPDKSLEEAAEEWAENEAYGKSDAEFEMAYKGFIAGAEWQKSQMPMPEDTILFNKGVAEGKRLMMEDTVEGEVIVPIYEGDDTWSAEIKIPGRYEIGQKVRIVVLKEKEE